MTTFFEGVYYYVIFILHRNFLNDGQYKYFVAYVMHITARITTAKYAHLINVIQSLHYRVDRRRKTA